MTADPAPGEVHLWRLWLGGRAGVDGLVSTLSPEERDRAARYRFSHHRDAFVMARATLRAILGSYCGVRPEHLRIGVTAHGKPFLTGGYGLRFNLSHSGDVVVYAVARGREVGIDVERIRHDVDHDALARRFFSEAEHEALRRLPEAARRDAFFACWTRKEAFVKGRGEGLSLGLDEFTVPVPPDHPDRPLEVRGVREQVQHWSLHALDADVGPGYAGALAVEGRVRRLVWRRAPPRAGSRT